MNINEMTIGDFKQIARIFCEANTKPVPFKVGNKYLIRGVTNYMIGEVVEIVGDFLVLDNASWVPDTGQFSKAFENNTLREVERTPNGTIVHMGAISDAQPWHHDLPTETKL